MADPSDKELGILEEFREQLNDLDLDRDLFKDMHLIRWFRARELNIPKAETMLRNHLEWREKNSIDTILQAGCSESLRNDFPLEICGFDKRGCPVIVIPYGKWDFRKAVVKNGHKKEVINMIYLYFEEIKALQEQESGGKYFKQFTLIIDFDGFSYRQFTSVEIVEVLVTCMRAFEANCPETLNRAFCVHVPAIFSLFWKMVKPFLSRHTLQKIYILGSEPRKVKSTLLKFVPKNQFPVRFGGSVISSFNAKSLLVNSNVDDTVSAISNIKEVPCDREVTKFTQVIVFAGDKVELLYEVVVPRTIINWAFKTELFDIGFCLLCENEKEIIAYEKVDSQKEEQIGSVVCEEIGRYILSFDNTYSRIRSKTLHYSVHLTEPKQQELDDEKRSTKEYCDEISNSTT